MAASGQFRPDRVVPRTGSTQHLPEIALPPTESTLAINDHAVTPLLAPRSITMITHKLQTETR